MPSATAEPSQARSRMPRLSLVRAHRRRPPQRSDEREYEREGHESSSVALVVANTAFGAAWALRHMPPQRIDRGGLGCQCHRESRAGGCEGRLLTSRSRSMKSVAILLEAISLQPNLSAEPPFAHGFTAQF